jgi:diadenosine tetraphosphate (Ap4A) HIT family hydrolase
MFTLDPAFEATSTPLAALPLCEARLQRDARWPWIVLIPRRERLVELEDLSPGELARLVEETLQAGRAVRTLGKALGRPVDKLNVGQLGNITRQLHVHVVGRRSDDAAWPGPVWGVPGALDHDDEGLAAARAAAMQAFL